MKYYVVLDGLNEGIFKDSKTICEDNKNYSKRKIYKFSSQSEAEKFYADNKRDKKFFTIALDSNDYKIAEISSDMNISDINNSNVTFKVFNGKENLIKYLDRNDKNINKMKNNNSYTCSETALYKDLFDYDVEYITTKENRKIDTLIAYIDGSFSQELQMYSSGIVLLDPNEEAPFKEISLVGNNSNILKYKNVAGEILASVFAMNYSQKVNAKKLVLYYDYNGVEDICKQNIVGKYLFFIYSMFYNHISKKIDIEFVKVKSHSKNKYNNRADKIAKDALISKGVL